MESEDIFINLRQGTKVIHIMKGEHNTVEVILFRGENDGRGKEEGYVETFDEFWARLKK